MRRVSLWAPPVLYAGMLFLLSSQAGTQTPGIPFLDKVLHFGAYGVLGLLVVRAVWGHGLDGRRAWVISVLMATLYGASDEFHQSFVPGRSSEWGDLFADGLGALVAVGLVTYFRERSTP